MKPLLQLLQRALLLISPLLVLSMPAWADTLQINYNVSQNQTALVGTTVIFTGSIKNISNAPVTFDTVGSGAVRPNPFVAGDTGGIPFPGITLAPGASTGTIDLAIVSLNPFDPSLTYPGSVRVIVEAVVPSGPGAGNIFAENDATITVVTSVPEPPTQLLLVSGLLGLGLLSRKARVARPENLA